MAWTDCIARLAQAAGRALSDDEVTAIFERIHKAALDIKAGRAQPDDVGLGNKLGKDLGVGVSQDQMIQAVAKRAADELLHQAAVRERQAYLQITKMGAREADVQQMRAAGIKPFDAIDGLLARDYSGRMNIESVEQRVSGIKANVKRMVAATWDALGNDWLGFFQDREKQITLLRELRGENTGDAVASKGARAYSEGAEALRQAFVAAGGEVGKLDDWAHPQHHSQERVAAAGKDKWIDFILPLLNRSRYVDDLGRGWGDDEMRVFLGKAWDTIATNGIANMQPGTRSGSGKLANRHAESRQIHFKDADSTISYWEMFGDRSLVEILDGHLDRLAKDTAFIEKFGPNPDLTYQTLRDRALQDTVVADPTQTEKMKSRALKSDSLYEYAAGRIKPTANQTVSNVADGIAALNSAGKLGGAFWASMFGDKVTYEAVSHLNDIPMMQRWQNELKLLNPVNAEDRRQLMRQGLMAEYVRNGLNRFYDDMGPGASGGWSGGFKTTSGKFANAVLRLTGMNAINELRKGAFGLSLMDAIGHEISSGRGFADLEQSDVRTLRHMGVTEADWKTWQLADLDEISGNKTVLTPESISRIPDDKLRSAGVIGAQDGADAAHSARRAAIVKLLGAVNTESDFAIVTPGWRERAQFYVGAQRGTFKGEIWRSFLQFKSFPWATFQRSLDLVANADTAVGKAAMTSYLLASTTLAGAMIIQVRDMLSGKDPRHMGGDDWYKFWGAAFMQGGALGIYGDFLNGINETRMGSGPLETFAGPTIGPLLELGLVHPLNALKAKAEGKETHLGAQSIQSLKGFIPGNNIWYAKAAIDHLVWQRVMEMVSPGYLSSIRSRSLHDYRQDWWWQPGETVPERAPAIEEATR
jgi:hypothetical protein